MEDRETSLAAIDSGLAAIQASVAEKVPGVAVESELLGRTNKRIKLLARRGETLVKVEVTPVLRGSVHPAETREATPQVQEQFGPAAAGFTGCLSLQAR